MSWFALLAISQSIHLMAFTNDLFLMFLLHFFLMSHHAGDNSENFCMHSIFMFLLECRVLKNLFEHTRKFLVKTFDFNLFIFALLGFNRIQRPPFFFQISCKKFKRLALNIRLKQNFFDCLKLFKQFFVLLF